jgi:predicted DNA binding CopG/RHH family protein
MKNEYDLSKLQSRRNPYSAKLKKSVTLKIGGDVIDYFKSMASEVGIPYNSLINLYLQDCVAEHRKVNISWNKAN